MSSPIRPVLPEGWCPPMPFRLTMPGREGKGPLAQLWSMPYLVESDGEGGQRVVEFLVCGPAGVPVGTRPPLEQLPSVALGSRLRVPTTFDQYGQMVFAQAQQTLN